jgi:hypothetical protein
MIREPKVDNLVKAAPNKGRITMTGTTGDRPSFRLIFEKTDVLTPKDTRGLIASYRESIRPRQAYR